MGTAFEITTLNVETVLERQGIHLSKDAVEGVFDRLDCDEVEEAALCYLSMEAQTNAAHCEIEDQLIREGLIPATNEKKSLPPDEDIPDEDDDDEYDDEDDDDGEDA